MLYVTLIPSSNHDGAVSTVAVSSVAVSSVAVSRSDCDVKLSSDSRIFVLNIKR